MAKEGTPSVWHNFIMNFLLKTSGIVFAAISYPYAYRVLGAEGVGRTSFVTSVVSLFSLAALLGIPTYGIRACARVRDDKATLSRTVRELLMVQMVSTAVVVLILVGCVQLIPRLTENAELFYIQVVALLISACGTEWYFAGTEQYTYIAIRSTLVRAVMCALTFLLVRRPTDYGTYMILLAGATAIPCLLNLPQLHRQLSGGSVWERHQLRRHIRPTLVFFFQTAAITVYTNLDSAMLGFLQSNYWVGIYDAALKIKIVLCCFTTCLGTVLSPRLSYYFHTGRLEDFDKNVRKSTEFTVITGLPLAIFFCLTAPECVAVLFGEGYAAAALPFQILSPTVLLIGLSSVTGTQLLTAMGKEKVVMCSCLAGAVVDFAANWVLIPRYAANGAAIGTLLAEAAVLVVQICALRRQNYPMFKEVKWSATLAAAVMAMAIPAVLKMWQLSPILYMAIALPGYFLCAAGVLIVLREPLLCSALQRIYHSPDK